MEENYCFRFPILGSCLISRSHHCIPFAPGIRLLCTGVHLLCRYGAVVLDGSSRLPNSSYSQLHHHSEAAEEDEEVAYWAGFLAYGVLVNASAVHGAPIFMNLVNSAALQAIVASESESEALGVGDGEGRGVNATQIGSFGGGGEENALPSITIRSSPLPRTRSEELSRQV